MEVSSYLSLTEIPLEVKEYILTKLDGVSLMKMRFVSREWKKLLDNPNKKLLKKWKEVCESEINCDALRSLLNTLAPKYHIHIELKLWENVYKSWFRWSFLPRWNVTQTKLHSFSNCEISSIVNSGEWLLISTRNYGSVVAFNHLTKSTELLFLGGNVKDIRPYTVTEDLPLLLGIAHDNLMLEFENLTVADLNLHTLEINFFEELTGRRQTYHFENKVVQIEISKDRSIITLSRIPGKEIKKIELLDHWSIEHCWPNRNLLCCNKGHYIVTDDDFIQIDDHPFYYLEPIHPGEASIKLYFGGSAIISVNKKHYCNHEMIVRTLDRQQLYKPFIAVSHHITSVIYYGMNLFLGTDMGNVYIYHTKHIVDLLDLDLCNPSAMWEFGNEPIISITLKETNYKPIIFAASPSQIYQITFL